MQKLSYSLNYKNPTSKVSKNSAWFLSSRWLDGLVYNMIGVEKKSNDLRRGDHLSRYDSSPPTTTKELQSWTISLNFLALAFLYLKRCDLALMLLESRRKLNSPIFGWWNCHVCPWLLSSVTGLGDSAQLGLLTVWPPLCKLESHWGFTSVKMFQSI